MYQLYQHARDVKTREKNLFTPLPTFWLSFLFLIMFLIILHFSNPYYYIRLTQDQSLIIRSCSTVICITLAYYLVGKRGQERVIIYSRWNLPGISDGGFGQWSSFSYTMLNALNRKRQIIVYTHLYFHLFMPFMEICRTLSLVFV